MAQAAGTYSKGDVVIFRTSYTNLHGPEEHGFSAAVVMRGGKDARIYSTNGASVPFGVEVWYRGNNRKLPAEVLHTALHSVKRERGERHCYPTTLEEWQAVVAEAVEVAKRQRPATAVPA